MPNPTERAARTYVAAWQERDAVARARLLEGCFAIAGRIVSPGAIIRGRAALAAEIDAFFADPRGLSARLASAIDAQGPIFRFRSLVEDRDGGVVFDGFDAGELDVEGRITVLLTFGGAPPKPISRGEREG
jgi:hypothetical protein